MNDLTHADRENTDSQRRSRPSDIPTECDWCSNTFLQRRYAHKNNKRNFCSPHCYDSWRASLVRWYTPEELKQKVIENAILSDEESCWIWVGSTVSTGYGLIRKGRAGQRMTAHRASYEVFVGPIPEGQIVCHICDNPGCVNPYHLFLGSHADNTQDMISKQRDRLIGSRNTMAKLREEDVKEIVSLVEGGQSQTSVAKRFGVHVATVNDIVRGKTWTSVTNRKGMMS